ncbi:type II secretion system minor pseudopilin GspK [Wenzhouxiangella sp. AB-CW3]|uniref:type II secretion system minor pseudopilin GspK n=1 Tax=Wenzhouxiangella sp. AB-CW3 TaxID=2771012 RepID=UPI00168B1934|nr:type II secretion system minor pseudopilin GspK [Wenzhouxiangella sp. AB-CW3]QOC23139.1 type II secretion system minor pseudopilin GspK [Wenzhouxiangella sp. AB-CW3]
MPDRQRGGALLIALLAVALATVIAVALIERGQQGMARTEALLISERAWQYARGMESLAAETIRRAQGGEVDPTVLDGTWTEPFEVPGGFVQGRLIDQQARFNVNALIHPDAAHAARARDTFARLLDRLGLEAGIAEELLDWLEGATMPRPGSAADDWYMRLNPPYRTAGSPMATPSELRWLRSVDADAWQQLADVVTALPNPDMIININTAPAELVASLFEELDDDQARRVMADGPFSSRSAFLEHPVIQPLAQPGMERYLTTGSLWFLAQSRVVLDGIERDYFRLLTAAGPGYDEFRYLSQGVP